jgi:2-polyprenyl-3-methyl-5-hydroxy-6-metoxy-1,4-benzoquinol methylase
MSSKDQKLMYEKTFHDENKINFNTPTLKKVKKILENTKKGKLLDVGCNDGYFSKLFKGFDYFGVDIIEVKKNNILKNKIKQADITKGFPYSAGFFDVVFASEILEHVFDTDFFLSECSRVLRKGGVLILTTPNCVPLHGRILTLFGKKPFSTESRIIVGKTPGHIRVFTKKDLIELFRDNNFEIEKMYGKEIKFVPFGNFFANIFPSLSTGFVIKAKNKK